MFLIKKNRWFHQFKLMMHINTQVYTYRVVENGEDTTNHSFARITCTNKIRVYEIQDCDSHKNDYYYIIVKVFNVY